MATGDRPFLTVRGSVIRGNESATVTGNGIESENGIENGSKGNRGKEIGNVSARQESAKQGSAR